MAKTSKLATAFNVWYSNADMPELQNGVWVDLETGLPFMPVAKVEVFDGQDLEGTVLQQKSAGKIRNKMLGQLTAEQAEVIAKIKVAKWFLNCKSVLIANIARYCDAHIAMTKAGNRKQLQWLADSVGLGFGKSTFHIDGKGELPSDSTIARIEAIIAKEKAIAEEEAAKQLTIVDSTIATSADIAVGTTVFFSECWDEEYGSYYTASAIVSSINSAVYDDGEVIEFSLKNSRGEYVGSGYAWENGARMFGNGDVYLTADAVPAVNCSSEEINWEEQG